MTNMTTDTAIVGVRFVEAGRISYCSPAALRLGTGDYVVVRTDRGERLGWVVLAADQVLATVFDGPIRVVDRLASEADVLAYRDQQARAAEDMTRVQAIATQRDARIRIASLMYDLDARHADITFVSRDQDEAEWLRRDAARLLNANVQLEQVGDRDRAKSLGGLGQCGRALCCSSWQVEFPAISIKMAKDQGLAPNPSKISGVCGRLLCCLSFEVDAYREILGTLPKVGKRISTPVGRARVISINAIAETVRMRMDDTNEIVEMPAAALRAQYGTAVRPVDLEEQFEEALHAQDRDRKDNLLAVLEPVSIPTAPRRTEGRPDRPRPARDDAEAPARPPRTRGRTAPRGERAAPDASSTARPGRPGVAGRRPARPGAAAGDAAGAPRADSAARSPRPPRPATADESPRPDSEGDPERRRRRRGRRGGRGRGDGEGGAPAGGTPATE